MASDSIEGDIEDGEFPEDKGIKWVIVVNLNKGTWQIEQATLDTQIGEVDIDFSGEDDIRVAAFFDSNVEALLEAIIELGGNSLGRNRHGDRECPGE